MALTQVGKALIEENLFALIKHTKCSLDFLTKFKSHRVFHLTDIEAITSMKEDSSAIDQSFQFYKRLLASTTTADVFELLLTALRETDQVTAYKILLSGASTSATAPSAPTARVVESGSEELCNIQLDLSKLLKTGVNFTTPPDAITDFVKSPKDKVLLLECPEPKVTLARILDTLRVTLVLIGAENVRETSEPLYLLQFQRHTVEQTQTVIVSLANDSKLIILHSPGEDLLALQNNLGAVPKAQDDLKWEDLTPSFQTNLVEKVKQNCGFKLTLLPQMMYGKALLRLLNTDYNNPCSSHSLLGKICEDHVTPKLGNVALSEPLLEDLGRIALSSMFPQWEWTIFGQAKYLDEPSLTRLVSSNLLKQTFKFRFDYEFVNSWMNHYFIGLFLSRGRGDKDLRSFFEAFLKVKESLVGDMQSYAFVNPRCAYFLNFHLKPTTQLQVDAWPDIGNAVLACVNGKLEILLQVLLPKLHRPNEKLIKAVVNVSPTVADILLQRFAELGYLLSGFFTNETLLHVAVGRGKLELSSKLLFDYGFNRYLAQKQMRNIIHVCVENTLDLSEAEVAERAQIVELFVSLDRSLLEEKFGKLSVPPLLSPRIHLSLIKYLLQIGANIFYTNPKDQCRHLGHVVAIGRSPEQYHDVISFLASTTWSRLLNVKDDCDLSPMHYAVFHTDLLDKTIQLFQARGVRLNGVSKEDRTILFHAIDKCRSIQFIRALVNQGVDWRRKDLYRQTVLFRSVRRGNLEAIRYFVNLGLNVNGTDHWGRTPLHKCFIRNTLENQVEVVRLLISLGAEVNKKDELGNRPLWWATKGPSKDQNKQDAVLLLKTKGGKK